MNLFKSKKSTKHKKLYKVVYYGTGFSTYDRSRTLLVTGKSPADAIENFYAKVNGRVTEIVEFTEINYGSDVKKEVTDGV